MLQYSHSSFLSLFSLRPDYISLFIPITFLILSPSLCLFFSPDFDYFILSDREDRILRQRSIVQEIKDRISLSLQNNSKNQNGEEVQGPVQGLVQGLSSSLLSAQTILKSHEVIYCILYTVYFLDDM